MNSDSHADSRSEYDPASHRRSYELGAAWVAPESTEPLRLVATWVEDAVAIADQVEGTAMALATATPEGVPSVRMVLCKGVDEVGGTIRWFSSVGSRKGQELTANPHAAATFWWPDLQRQLRVEGVVEQLSASEADAYFATRPRSSQLAAHTSQQSQVLESREQFDAAVRAAEERFAGDDAVPRPGYWTGWKMHVETIEFWRGREGRMHDRVQFSLFLGGGAETGASQVVDEHGRTWKRVWLQP